MRRGADETGEVSTPRRAVRDQEVRPAPVEPPGMTASYRDSLGTLTGRILEADLTPAIELPVSILEVLPTRALFDRVAAA